MYKRRRRISHEKSELETEIAISKEAAWEVISEELQEEAFSLQDFEEIKEEVETEQVMSVTEKSSNNGLVRTIPAITSNLLTEKFKDLSGSKSSHYNLAGYNSFIAHMISHISALMNNNIVLTSEISCDYSTTINDLVQDNIKFGKDCLNCKGLSDLVHIQNNIFARSFTTMFDLYLNLADTTRNYLTRGTKISNYSMDLNHHPSDDCSRSSR